MTINPEIMGMVINGIIALASICALVFTHRNIRETFRPYVHLSVRVEGEMIKMVLQNTGARAAYHVVFEFDNPLYPQSLEKEPDNELLAFNFNTKSFFHSLAPHSTTVWDLDHTQIR